LGLEVGLVGGDGIGAVIGVEHRQNGQT